MLLCTFDDLPDSGARAFPVLGRSALVVKLADDRVSVFINRCPHLGIPLQWQEDRFLDSEGVFVQCATHGALFEKASGLCIQGPCRGEHLWALTHDIRGNEIHLDESEFPAVPPLVTTR